jgi:predicted PurR-regulated permease PerM
LHLSRGAATGLIFLVILLAILGVLASPTALIGPVQRLVKDVQEQSDEFATRADAFLNQPIIIGGYTLDLSDVYGELSGMLRAFVGSVAQGTLDVAVNIASGAFWLIFILMAAFYLVKDADTITGQFDELTPPGYGDDIARLRQQITDVWHAFLRGQLLLGGAMIVITTLGCMAVGLPYPLVMGLIAGVMEFVPNVGPIIALVPAALVALFQGSNFLPLSNPWFMVVVIVLYIVIQQIEGNVLIPRILGRSLNLHPLLVFIAVIAGGSLAGILGMLLAAPVLATLRVVFRYTLYRLYDRDPFTEMDQEAQPPKPGVLERACKAAWCQLQEQIEQRKEKQEQSAQSPENQENDITEPGDKIGQEESNDPDSTNKGEG